MRAVRARSHTRESKGESKVVRCRPRGRPCVERGRLRPGRRGPPTHPNRNEAGLRQQPSDVEFLQPEVVGEVGAGGDAKARRRQLNQRDLALIVVEIVVQDVGRNRSFGQVVDASPADATGAGELPAREQELGGRLHLRPTPPLRGLLGPAEFGGSAAVLRRAPV